MIGYIAAALDLNFADDPLSMNGCIAFRVLSHF